MNTNINYIAADEGHIDMYSNGDLVGIAKTAKTICWYLQEMGFDGSVNTSSSIDFASEYGFETDDEAKELWEAGVSKYYAAKCN